MKLWRAMLIPMLLAFCTTGLQAGPHVIIHDPPGQFEPAALLSFTFNSDAAGGGMLAFTNVSGLDWLSLTIYTPPPLSPDPITCGTDTFATCTILPGQFGYFATIVFAGPPYILDNESFFIDLGNKGWTPNAQFLAVAEGGHVPEPGTLLLFVGGIASVLARKRLL